jgi:hypothetical protein
MLCNFIVKIQVMLHLYLLYFLMITFKIVLWKRLGSSKTIKKETWKISRLMQRNNKQFFQSGIIHQNSLKNVCLHQTSFIINRCLLKSHDSLFTLASKIGTSVKSLSLRVPNVCVNSRERKLLINSIFNLIYKLP